MGFRRWLGNTWRNLFSRSSDEDSYEEQLQEASQRISSSIQRRIADVRANVEFYRSEDVLMQRLNILRPSGVLTLNVKRSNISPTNFDNENIYKCFSRPKGFCIIIDNEHFVTKPPRLGTKVDCYNLLQLFGLLGYDVEIHREMTASKIQLALKVFAEKAGHAHVDSCVVIILSHGNEQGILGVDERVVKVDDVVACLDRDGCPDLCGKPKLFILQACRGKTKDPKVIRSHKISSLRNRTEHRSGSVQASSDLDDYAESALDKEKDSVDGIDGIDGASRSIIERQIFDIPSHADILIAYATTPGFVSWRNEEVGSWFIQSICEIFAKNAHCEHVMDMLTMVNQKVASVVMDTEFKQIPEPACRLRKKFYFFPGTYRD